MLWKYHIELKSLWSAVPKRLFTRKAGKNWPGLVVAFSMFHPKVHVLSKWSRSMHEQNLSQGKLLNEGNGSNVSVVRLSNCLQNRPIRLPIIISKSSKMVWSLLKIREDRKIPPLPKAHHDTFVWVVTSSQSIALFAILPGRKCSGRQSLVEILGKKVVMLELKLQTYCLGYK